MIAGDAHERVQQQQNDGKFHLHTECVFMCVSAECVSVKPVEMLLMVVVTCVYHALMLTDGFIFIFSSM